MFDCIANDIKRYTGTNILTNQFSTQFNIAHLSRSLTESKSRDQKKLIVITEVCIKGEDKDLINICK